MNPRYELYLQTTSNPTNWDYMDFINKMKIKFIGDLYSPIENHDDFTSFIRNEVAT